MAQTRRQGEAPTATRILDVAERIVQIRGFNGFSYADVASELRISKAALHYHFASKAELGLALVERYAERFRAALGIIDRSAADAQARLQGYASIYADVLRQRRMCLCGMLAAEYDTLPGPMQERIISFFDENEVWLTAVLAQGQAEGSLRLHASGSDEARAILSGLEGALLIARPYGDVGRFEAAAARVLSALSSAPKAAT
jgi:TetR/AcrR family transcriptional repressor of nem operon